MPVRVRVVASKMTEQRIHGLPPVVGREAKLLVLGTMPGARSLADLRYYAHPRNAFWRVVGLDREPDYTARCRALTLQGIALWDVLATCLRKGSLDGAIKDPEPNDLAAFVRSHTELRGILFNGQAARKLFDKYARAGDERVALPDSVELRTMPSTSPANTRQGKVEAWQLALDELAGHP